LKSIGYELLFRPVYLTLEKRSRRNQTGEQVIVSFLAAAPSVFDSSIYGMVRELKNKYEFSFLPAVNGGGSDLSCQDRERYLLISLCLRGTIYNINIKKVIARQ